MIFDNPNSQPLRTKQKKSQQQLKAEEDFDLPYEFDDDALRQEKYKPLHHAIEEEKTEENVTVENDDNYGLSNSQIQKPQKRKSQVEDGYSSS